MANIAWCVRLPGRYKKPGRKKKHCIFTLTRQHAILSHPYVAVLTPSWSIHLIMGGGWEEMSQCQWPSHWDPIITSINPSDAPSRPPSLLLFSSSLSPSHKHTSGIHMCLDDGTQNAHTHTEALLRVLTLTSFWKNNRPSRRRRRRHPPEATLTAVIKECEGMCVCRHVPGCVCVCFFCHFHTLSAFVFSSRVPIFTF